MTVTPGGGPTVTPWINEFHYDNKGGDRNEFVEIAGPAGTDVSGWTVVGYNGSGGAVYGFAQDPATSGRHRPGPATSVPGLYLASAFAQPGGGFTGAMLAGRGAFQRVERELLSRTRAERSRSTPALGAAATSG